ncbi:hypothetical protein OG943_11495 [Amycolatopsis sp. NBC_00345]|uniref:hypothetical protein n=1 Tax=Amycolatopsis sp. NBC_00345 TaxID=2975955 RepID=UPI002E261FFC
MPEISRLPPAAALAWLALLLAGCSTPSGPAQPSGPALSAADGTRLDACANGRCEVVVRAADQVPLPSGAGFRVQSVGADGVTIAVSRDVAVQTMCLAGCTQSQSAADDYFQLDPRASVEFGGRSISVEAVSGDTAKLSVLGA